MDLKLVKENLNKFAFIKENPDESIIFTDVDGTLSEIAQNPAAAVVAPKMKNIIAALADIYQVVAISGRPSPAIKEMIGSENIIYIGSHGRERLGADKRSAKDSSLDNQVIEEIKAAAAALAPIKGVYIEYKDSAVALHYRLADNKNQAKAKILKLINPVAKRLGLKVIKGRMVVELSSAAIDKGEAMSEIIKELGKEKVLYLGDDQTDVDAFIKIKELRSISEITGFALGVLSPEAPTGVKAEADYFFNSVGEVASFLQWLTEITC